MVKSTAQVIEYAREKYGDIKRKDDSLLVDHALRVYHGVSSWEAKQAALLHDILEDTDTGFSDLIADGIDPRVVDIVVMLTRVGKEPYLDYILRVRSNQAAREVKTADIRDNLEGTVGGGVRGNLREKYLMALWILEGV